MKPKNVFRHVWCRCLIVRDPPYEWIMLAQRTAESAAAIRKMSMTWANWSKLRAIAILYGLNRNERLPCVCLEADRLFSVALTFDLGLLPGRWTAVGLEQWRFHAGWLGSTGPLTVARPRNLVVFLTHWGQLILRKISKFDATSITDSAFSKTGKAPWRGWENTGFWP